MLGSRPVPISMLSVIGVEFLDPKFLIEKGGPLLLFLIIFAESGLLIGFFLPGDSLIFTGGAVAGGALASLQHVHINVVVLCIGCFVAAVLGDQVGYMIGLKAGPKVFNRPDSKFFRHEHVDRATEFFDRYGPKAIVLARFVPVVRTFVPTIAGVSRMHYSTFLRYNALGGLIWGTGVTLLGYYFGKIQAVRDHFELAILGVIAISLLPIAFEVISHLRGKSKNAESSPS